MRVFDLYTRVVSKFHTQNTIPKVCSVPFHATAKHITSFNFLCFLLTEKLYLSSLFWYNPRVFCFLFSSRTELQRRFFFTVNDSRRLDLFEFKTLQLIILLHQTSHVILQSKLNTMTVSCTKVHVLYYTDNFSVILISLIRKKTSISNYKIWNLELT